MVDEGLPPLASYGAYEDFCAFFRDCREGPGTAHELFQPPPPLTKGVSP